MKKFAVGVVLTKDNFLNVTIIHRVGRIKAENEDEAKGILISKTMAEEPGASLASCYAVEITKEFFESEERD